MQEFEKTGKVRKEYFVIFLITLVIKLLFLCQSTVYGINMDRIGDLAAPVTLAGLDWSAMIKEVNYYGYGFKWIYFIFFRITDSPYAIYFCITVMYSVLMAFLAVLIYHIQLRYIKVDNKKLALLVAVFMGAVGSCDMKSESSVYLATWVMCYMLVKAICVEDTDKKKKRIMAVVLAVFQAYCMTLHGRMLAVILAFMIVLFFYYFVFRRWIVSPGFYIGALAVLYTIVSKATDLYQIYFWGKTGVANSSALPNSTKSLYFIRSFTGFKVAVKCALSNLFTLGTNTYGLGWIAVCIFAYSVVCMLKKAGECDEQDRILYGLLWFFGMCTAIVIAGLVTRWGKNVYYGNLYGYKGFVYGRYFLNFVYPAIMVAVLWVDKHKVGWRGVLAWCVCGILGVLLFFTRIYPELQYAYTNYVSNERTSTTCIEWLLFYGFNNSKSVTFNLVIDLIIIAIIISFVVVSLVRGGFTRYVCYCSLALVIFSSTAGFKFDIPKVQFSGYNDTYACIKELEEKGVIEQGSRIYSNFAPYVLQYMLNRYSVVWGYPEEYDDAAIYIAYGIDDFINNNPGGKAYYYTMINQDEVLCTNDSGIVSKMTDCGYDMEQVPETIPDEESAE